MNYLDEWLYKWWYKITGQKKHFPSGKKHWIILRFTSSSRHGKDKHSSPYGKGGDAIFPAMRTNEMGIVWHDVAKWLYAHFWHSRWFLQGYTQRFSTWMGHSFHIPGGWGEKKTGTVPPPEKRGAVPDFLKNQCPFHFCIPKNERERKITLRIGIKNTN